jgi:hypothetical protein
LDDARAVDEESGAFRNAPHAESDLWQEGPIGDAVGLGHGMLVVAEEGDGDPFLLRPSLLRKGIVAADPVDGAVERIIGTNPLADLAEFGRQTPVKAIGTKSRRI